MLCVCYLRNETFSMTNKNKKSHPLLLFYLLVGYVFLQSLWWSYHLLQLDNELYQLKSSIVNGNGEGVLKKHWSMIIGEASVFILLLVLGAIKIRKTFKTEARLARQQNNFLLSVTHELRSPLASARLQMETLEKRELPKEKQNEILTSSISDLDRLKNLVDNLLLATSIDNSGFRLHMEEHNFSGFLKNVVVKARSSFDPIPNIIEEIQPDVFVRFDPLAFTSVIINLIENGLKYSENGSVIKVILKEKEGKANITIADEGLGIPGDEIENIFKKFYRIGNEETRKTKGTGLGLYIVKRLVDEHKGQINVSPNSPNGTVFEIILPAKAN